MIPEDRLEAVAALILNNRLIPFGFPKKDAIPCELCHIRSFRHLDGTLGYDVKALVLRTILSLHFLRQCRKRKL